jgi:hypothetical protein
MDTYTRCVITGCALQRYNEKGYVAWGDLHQQGDTFIFNANVHVHDSGRVSTEWYPSARCSDDEPKVTVPTTADHFERRGIWVFHEDAVNFNLAALERMESDKVVKTVLADRERAERKDGDQTSFDPLKVWPFPNR